MKAVAAVVMVVGLTLMSAPIVLPRLGVDLTKALGASVSAKAPHVPGSGQGVGQGAGGVAAAVSQWVGAVGGLLGTGGSGKAPSTASGVPSAAEVQAQFAAACGALSGANGSVDCGGNPANFAAAFGAAAKMTLTGEMPASAFATGPGQAAPSPVLPGKSKTVEPRRASGAKFLKAPGAKVEEGTD